MTVNHPLIHSPPFHDPYLDFTYQKKEPYKRRSRTEVFKNAEGRHRTRDEPLNQLGGVGGAGIGTGMKAFAVSVSQGSPDKEGRDVINRPTKASLMTDTDEMSL